MRRLLILLLLAACLMPGAGPAQAQATADQLNRLSLEALTTPAPGGNPGSSRSYRRSSYRGSGSYRSAYRRSGYRRSVERRSGYRSARYHTSGYRSGTYHTSRPRYVASGGYRRSSGRRHSVGHYAARHSRQAGYYRAPGYAPGYAALRHGH